MALVTWRLTLAAVLVTAATGACANVDYVPTNAPPRPMRRRAAVDVEVFPAGLPSRPYVEVARLEIDAPTNDPEMLVDQLRQAAAEHGCDGVVFVGGGAFHAVCIVYRDAP